MAPTLSGRHGNHHGDAYTSHLITGLPEQDKKQGVITFNYLRATALIKSKTFPKNPPSPQK